MYMLERAAEMQPNMHANSFLKTTPTASVAHKNRLFRLLLYAKYMYNPPRGCVTSYGNRYHLDFWSLLSMTSQTTN